MTTQLACLDTLRTFINLKRKDTRYDDVLQKLAKGSSTLIEEYLHRGLEAKERVLFHKSYDARWPIIDVDPQLLWLDAYPVDENSPFSMRYSFYLKWDTQPDLIPNQDFVVDRELGIVRVFPTFGTPPLLAISGYLYRAHPLGFRITYTGGYPMTEDDDGEFLDVPEEIATACAMQTSWFFQSWSRGSLGLDDVAGDKASTKKTIPKKSEDRETLLPEVRALLRPFVRKGPQVGRRV